MVIAPPELALVKVEPPGSPGAAAPALIDSPTLPTTAGRERFFALLRMLFVGLWSSGVDLIVLVMCFRWFHLGDTISRLVGLAVSGLLLFFGCRSFAFRAQAGNISRQAKLFTLAELVGFPLNLGAFHALSACLPFALAPELTSQAANFLVFIGFSFPVRRWLFRGVQVIAG
jgi:putative flippase GtrA